MKVFALDPGPVQTGWVRIDGKQLTGSGVMPNGRLLLDLMSTDFHDHALAIEMIASYGMAVGAEVFETCVWIGRFQQAWWQSEQVTLVKRQQVKQRLVGNVKAKDANIRAAILDLFPRTGAGAVPQVGTKKNPGPLFGVSTHAWPALGVAITVSPVFNNETASPNHIRLAPGRVALRVVPMGTVPLAREADRTRTRPNPARSR